MPHITHADATCLAWVETGLWGDQDKADAQATEHVTTTIAALVRDFGDTLVADCSRAYDRWRRSNGTSRVARRKRHDQSVGRWVGKEAEKMRARGEHVGGTPAEPPPADPAAVTKLEQEFGR